MTNAEKSQKRQTPVIVSKDDLFSGKTTLEALAETHTSELVIALCGPIGSPLHEVGDGVSSLLQEKFGYEQCVVIRLSSFIEQHAPSVGVTIPPAPRFTRVNSQIDAGNQLRTKHGKGVLAELAINQIRMERERYKVQLGAERHKPRKICHVVDSIKNQEELDTLRTVYRDMLYVVGVFSPLGHREELLNRKGLHTNEVFGLIDRDSGEEFDTGQTVRDTFPQCDFFLRMDGGTDSQLASKVERFLHLILGTKIVTPTAAETAMYAAASAAGNSACLSRQVGAAVTDSDGEVIAVGWNDVPKFGGGLYLNDAKSDPNGDKDKRCWNRDGGKCFNDEEKRLLANALLEDLVGIVPPQLVEEARDRILKSDKVRGLIEFSRSIHAEMHALLNAGKTAGHRLQNGKLFVTTYPCHSCARHIIAAGISEVIYIEPYRKSLATKLHQDAITEREPDDGRVRILQYDGVAPSRYYSLFRMNGDTRKRSGKMIRINPKEATPKIEKSLEALPALEGMVIESLIRKHLVDEPKGGGDGTRKGSAADCSLPV